MPRVNAMLAYVFWHWPGEGIGADRYLDRLLAFHRALAASPSRGLRGTEALAVDGEPWPGAKAASGRLYEDWYMIEDFAALGALNEAAVSFARKEPHDAVASLAAGGAAGIYRILKAAPVVEEVSWFAKPPGMTYGELLERIPEDAGLSQRQLVLGPAPEFRLAGPAPSGITARSIRVRSLHRTEL